MINGKTELDSFLDKEILKLSSVLLVLLGVHIAGPYLQLIMNKDTIWIIDEVLPSAVLLTAVLWTTSTTSWQTSL